MKPTTGRARALLQEEGWEVALVERYIPQARRRFDAFGFVDMLAIKAEHPIMGVQTCAYDRMADHRAKILGSSLARLWLDSGGMIELQGWEKRPIKRGAKRLVWKCKRERITLAQHQRYSHAHIDDLAHKKAKAEPV